jgi:hypothetical protein
MVTAGKARVANPIAVRRYGVIGEPEREVVLTIGKPRPDPDPAGDWMCSVLIEGLPEACRRRIHGVDALQALQLATEYARRTIDASGLVLTWLKGMEPGDVGLPLAAPIGWGLDFQLRLERRMAQAEQRVARAVIVAKNKLRARGR